ncbi:MAG TPA: hypothetical protein VFD06_12885, partial [Candidatus Polarisedimenticolia bacterium]|nr:hypothetical protein [Candidatus Polarisedimenticolia bacterium]
MKIRTVLYLTLGAILVAVLSVLYTTNRAVLDQSLSLGHGITMPVWGCLLLASLLSMLIPILFGLLKDAREFLSTLTSGSR